MINKNLQRIRLCFPCHSFLLLCVVFMAISSNAQLSEANYRIYGVQEGREVTISEIAKAMQDYDVLFFGEEHNDSVTHYLEAAMLKAMHDQYGDRVVLSMEMFDREAQHIMDEYLAGIIREKNFVKDARAWPNYRDYKPMVEFARTHQLDVICANAPSRYSNLAGRKGQEALWDLPRSSRDYFAPLPYDTASGAYHEKLTGMGGHSVTAPPATTSKDSIFNKDSAATKPLTVSVDTTAKASNLPAMSFGDFNLIMAQSLWDATMAYSIVTYLKKHKGRKVMQVNGRFHSDEGFAVATQLSHYDPTLGYLIISSDSDENFPAIDWSKYSMQGDYIIITDPAVPKTYKDQ